MTRHTEGKAPRRDLRRRDCPTRFAGRTAVVTGTNSRSFGGAVAERLAREGAAIMLLDKDEPARLMRLLDRLGAQYKWQRTDVTSQQQVEDAIDTCLDAFGGLDVVVNAAGIGHVAPVEQLSDEQWRDVFEVDVMGTMRVIRASLPHLPDGDGAIVNVSSSMGLNGCTGYSLYSTSKAGLIGMTRSLAAELAPRRIRVVCVAPGMAHTPMMHQLAQHFTVQDREDLKASHPLGMGTPHDVATAVAFLASYEANWITGVTLPLGWAHLHDLPVEKLWNNPEPQEHVRSES